jgi:LemA protein
MGGVIAGVAILLGALGFTCGGTAAFGIVTYNKLIKRKNAVKNAFAQMATQQQRKMDLIPNLLGTLKLYIVHEQGLLEKVESGREKYLLAETEQEKLALSTQVSSDMKQLMLLGRTQTGLGGNANFLQLQEEFAEAEDKIAFSRQFYNDAVTIYNNKLQMFPNNVVAGIFGFQEEELLYEEE